MVETERKRLPFSVSVAVFIEDEKGRLLLVQQTADWKGNKWGPPAGGMVAYEDPIMAALRETKEEIDTEVELLNLIGIYTVVRGENASGVGFVFRGKIRGEIRLAKGEIMSFHYFSPEKIQELIEKDLIYKPEYNLPAINDWLDGRLFPLEIIKRITPPE